jgi:orotidine-5'-phosphate decarboxylase
MLLERKTGIILALDLPNKKQALSLLHNIRDQIDCVKVGHVLVLKEGLRVIRQIKKIQDLPVIADFKICDIPYISGKIAKTLVQVGCDGIVVHGFMGPDGIEECVKEAKGGMIFVVTELTSLGGEIFMQPVADDVARMAKELGAYGIQAPATRPHRIERLRQIVGDGITIISCGIGAQGSPPGTAIKAGADFEIIGRLIYDSSNPLESARKARSLIKEALGRLKR